MSVIAALRQNNEVWIGSDTQSTAANLSFITPKKWIVRHPWAVAVAGSLRMVSAIDAHPHLLQDLATPWQFTERIQDLMDKVRYTPRPDSGPTSYDDEYILAHPDAVWSICNTLSIQPIQDGDLFAAGSGERLALGAGHATRSLLAPPHRLYAALEAATQYDTTCGGKIWMRRL